MFLVLLKWEVAAIIGGKVGKVGRMVRREGGSFLVLFKGGEYRVSPRFYLFVSDVNQGNKGAV